MLLRPELFLPQTDLPHTTASAVLVAQLCDYMHAHLEAGLTLTDLEAFSGFSARSLQLAFKKQLDCSPMQWANRERISLAHSRLSNALPGDTVTSIATACGFCQLGAFSVAYRKRFGESPSLTLQNAFER